MSGDRIAGLVVMIAALHVAVLSMVFGLRHENAVGIHPGEMNQRIKPMSAPPTTQTHEDNGPVRVSVLVAYEDYAAGKRALRVCQQLLPLAHLGRKLSTDLWKFDMLKVSAMRASAAEEAAGAELLVVAPQNGADLPADVREWVQTILLHPSRLKGLLLLAGPAPQDPEIMPLAEQHLAEVAAQLRCPLWCLRLEPPNGGWADPSYAAENLKTVAQAVFPIG